jgi:hypothetical protein
VKKERGRTIEVESVAELDQRVASGATSMSGWHLLALDLTGRSDVLRRLDVAGSLFLGCTFAPRVENDLRSRGALIFPVVPDVPVNSYRGYLYTPQELYDGLAASYEDTLDARAANLGAYFAEHDQEALDEAVEVLGRVPGFRPSVQDWATTAFEVLERWPQGTPSVGIPTWHYGHEPPNPFATDIAKYFKNAIREDILLHICDGGIVYLPGAGGTVQEIFQDACENYYAEPSTVAPMVLVGRDYWTRRLPAWPLLETLAHGRDMERVVHLVDTVDDVVPLLALHAGRPSVP